jgi:hypothetical protein
MFGKKNLLEDGSAAKAIILDARPGNVLNRHGERNWALRLRVHFDDGQTADAQCEVYDLGIDTVGPASGLEPYPLSTGTVIPVRYDPANRQDVVVDRPTMIADTRAAYAADQQQKIDKAEAGFAPTPASAPPVQSMDENALMDALAAAQTRGDSAEVDRLTKLVEDVISGSN